MSATLVIMVKAPLMGRAKTRLARQVGAVEAMRFYRAACGTLLRRVGHDKRWHTVLAVDPPRALRAGFWPTGLPRRPQMPGDLGARMVEQFRLAPHGPVILTGSDIPGVTAAQIAEAFALLRHNDAVLGPAEDGGYWLIGLRAGFRPRCIFAGVRWSSPQALSDTVDNLAGARIAWAATLFDVDDEVDWRRWKRAALPGRMP